MNRVLKPCGTRAAYMRHLRNQQVPCPKCAAANQAYGRAYRAEVKRILRRRPA